MPQRCGTGGDLGSTESAEYAYASADRFEREFEDRRVVGSGSFAVVYRARNRVDNQDYAIKKTKQAIARGSRRRKEVLQEVLALASVAVDSPSPYIVRYFGSWIEDGRLFIQTELCDGSLKDVMNTLKVTRPEDPRSNGEELAAAIRDVCRGLSVLHCKNLVHLDVKPENILVKKVLPSPMRSGPRVSRIHKIADLGLATAAIGSGCDEISEGDSRYLCREVLRGDFSELTKADVFSLGVTCYELATNPRELPCNGDAWHKLRDGFLEVPLLNHLSEAMVGLLHRMVRPAATERPPCAEVLRDPAVCVEAIAEVEELQLQLRQKTEAAERETQRRAAAEEKMATAEEKADRYWSELLHMKRQEMLRDGNSPSLTVDSLASGQHERSALSGALRLSHGAGLGLGLGLGAGAALKPRLLRSLTA